MDTDHNDEMMLQDRIDYSGPRKAANNDSNARKYYCTFCGLVVDVRPGAFRLCQSPACLQAAIRDRQTRIEELELEIPRVRRAVDEEEKRLREQIRSLQDSGGDSFLLSQYQSLLNSLLGYNRFFSKDNRVNQILEFQRQIEALARRIKRPTFTDDFRRYIWERDGKLCYLCRKRIAYWDGTHMQIDHIVARSKGGSDEEDNLRAAHPTCNLKKGKRALSSRKMRAVLNEIRKSEEQLKKERLF